MNKDYHGGLTDGISFMLALALNAKEPLATLRGSTTYGELLHMASEFAAAAAKVWDELYTEEDGCPRVDWEDFMDEMADWVATEQSWPEDVDIRTHCLSKWEGR